MIDDLAQPEAAATQPLDGVWLRRERERIAVGRRHVADRLQVAESRVASVELKKRPVPPEWIGVLTELGFRIPPDARAAATPLEAGTAIRATELERPELPTAVVEAPSTATVGSAMVAESSIGEVSSPPTDVEIAASPQPEHAPTAATAPPAPVQPTAENAAAAESGQGEAVSSPADVAVASSAQPKHAPQAVTAPSASVQPSESAQLLPAPTLPPRGKWLRSRRHELAISLRRLSKALSITERDLGLLEANDLVLPASWIQPLAALQIIDATLGASAARIEALSSLNGKWLRREREKKGVTGQTLSGKIHVRPAVLGLVEARDWPVPPEWLPALHRFGFSVPAALLPSSPGGPDKIGVPSTTAPPRPTTQRGNTADQLTGAWLQRQRQKKSISQQALSRHLNVSPSILCRCERKNRPLRSKWLPILSSLGFPIPTAPYRRSEDAQPATLPVEAKQMQPTVKQAVSPAPAPQVDGKWLQTERERLDHSRNKLRKQLGVDWHTYARVEQQSLPVPGSWREALRKLGFRLPTSPKSGAASQVAAPAVKKAVLRGLWLGRERKRLGLSQYDVRSELRVHWNTLASIERRNRAIPAAWLPTLRRLKMNVGDALAAPGKAVTAAAEPQDAATPTAPASPSNQPATSAPLPEDAAGLAEMIISYRLKYGRSAGQSPVEILAWVAHDLCQSGAGQAVTYEAVERAVKTLLPS